LDGIEKKTGYPLPNNCYFNLKKLHNHLQKLINAGVYDKKKINVRSRMIKNKDRINEN